MARPDRNVFVCAQQRPPGHPRGCCAAVGGQAVLQAFWKEQQARQAYEQVGITYSGCLGPCDGGVNVLVFPDSVLYQRVKPEDVAEIFDKHLIGGEVVTRLAASGGTW
ncbi:MAG TPA: (2Fe-2S) ferredoxin domain-containing protein [Aquabacterium sp.]|uniref:(2Fe-2S) ferredoxin domain-containing protein n=1 Tax=Aquabacterium sp. TaxID=1872578 RepID=UPI002DB3F1E0|nr:(2Fe-2S) ferredoxin domain-containing protein [Aquabacterium sp.]HET6787054.1 (2Fe-2S) ferredoxin domain-containing protein [Aquabacterium sp.]HEX5372315.1 (2Fe-2S) ferredoxin domain-containing protein [Aquabacterium sp.]